MMEDPFFSSRWSVPFSSVPQVRNARANLPFVRTPVQTQGVCASCRGVAALISEMPSSVPISTCRYVSLHGRDMRVPRR